MSPTEFYYFMLGFMAAVPDYKLLTSEELSLIKTNLAKVNIKNEWVPSTLDFGESYPQESKSLSKVSAISGVSGYNPENVREIKVPVCNHDYKSTCYPDELTLADYTLGDR